MDAIRDFNTHNMSAYFTSLAMAKPLSREEEGALADRIQAGDQRALDLLVQANLRFVVTVAVKYEKWLDLADLISAGNLGLVIAAGRFHRAKGCKFITYAVWWIRQSMLQTIAEQSRLIRLPINKVNMLGKLQKQSTKLAVDLEIDRDLEAWAEELASEMDVSAENIVEVVRANKALLSLDETWDGNDFTPLSAIPDTQSEAPDAALLEHTERQALDQVMAQLDEREKQVLHGYYGLDGGEPQTLEEIGVTLKVTRERTRQIRNKALLKLRRTGHKPLLQELRANIGQV